MEQLGPGAGDQKKENPNVFLVGSTWQRLLSGAEDVGLFKEYNDGSMRGFTCANKHNFTDFTGEVERILLWGFVTLQCRVTKGVYMLFDGNAH